MFVKMKIEHRTMIRRTWRNKGDIVEVSEAVANRLRAHKLAKPHVEAPAVTAADVQAMRDDGDLLRDACERYGIKASSWKDLLEKVG